MRYQDELNTTELKKYANALNQRAKSKGIAGRLTLQLLHARILDSGGKCEWCGQSVVNQAFEIDHIISLSKGGHNTVDNLAVACPDCNRRKSEKHPASFAQEMAQRGNHNALIERVLAHYEVEAHTQQSLLDENHPNEPTPPSETEDTPPPYRW